MQITVKMTFYVTNVRKLDLEKLRKNRTGKKNSAHPTALTNLYALKVVKGKRRVCIFHKIMTHAAF